MILSSIPFTLGVSSLYALAVPSNPIDIEWTAPPKRISSWNQGLQLSLEMGYNVIRKSFANRTNHWFLLTFSWHSFVLQPEASRLQNRDKRSIARRCQSLRWSTGRLGRHRRRVLGCQVQL